MIRQGIHTPRSLIKSARGLRRRRTPAESVMWKLLRGRKFAGLKFRRQHQITDFIVDFCCIELRLVIELDGEPHFEQPGIERDQARTGELQRMGYTVMRFENDDLLLNEAIVCEDVLRVAREAAKRDRR